MIQDDIRRIHEELGRDIDARLEEFRALYRRASEEELFAELVFCLFTPQSDALACWAAVERIRDRGLLLEGDADSLRAEMKGVRFHLTKSLRVIEARKMFFSSGEGSLRDSMEQVSDGFALREWLLKNVNGLGWKEASHFLRNIGKGEDFAILDRHILRCLKELDIISSEHLNLSPKIYLKLEQDMRQIAGQWNMSLAHLDFVLWYRAREFLFK